MIATIGLRVRDFGYRMVVSVVPCMDQEHGFGCTGMAVAKQKQETVSVPGRVHKHWFLALPLLFISFRVH